MATLEDIETFMSIAGVSEAVAIQKLEEHRGNLNAAINAHFSEGERNRVQETPVVDAQDDVMEIDDPVQVGPHAPPFPPLSSTRNLNPFSLLDPNFSRSIFDSGPEIISRSPFVSHPREVREIPIEVKDGSEQSSRSRNAPTIEDVTGTSQVHGPEIHGSVVLTDDNDEELPTAPATYASALNHGIVNRYPDAPSSRPSAPVIDDLPDYSNDIEEEMIRAAIEASKRDAELSNHQPEVLADPLPPHQQSHFGDTDYAHAVSLSLETAEREKALREMEGKTVVSDSVASADAEDHGKASNPSNGRLHVGSTSAPDEEAEDMEEQPLVRHRSRHTSIGSVETGADVEETDVRPASLERDGNLDAPRVNGNEFPDEWGGISSEEHDEAVMLEAAMFGGIPDGSGYGLPFAPHQLMQNGLNQTMGPYAPRVPRPPSPTLTAQRLLREQQDDEYLAALQADREKELKAKEEADAALAEERRKEEELRRKMDEEQVKFFHLLKSKIMFFRD
ncbi:OLC1v1029568C2 [Oldenlandia corymbosa var. corymbosa]|uniref:OLC1v1029568C2 n=1 Tax=Oldenlandia corymbosa var. corymbosa TaxID=529605 RepID=A0AAV1CFN0_OLDCO|nr:OLC1v1029568C2 [Oldenlandia corymbosa var. corymbosa]